ncbi:MAG: glycosyltransferase family 9 protein, partial [Bacteroidales bacterium]|nr:glycosyltransferase family 9 protein [Bacteroidales bacterium]
LQESAFCVSKATIILSGDTGLMHIAAALNKPLITVWGNTVPAFGMFPYMPTNKDKYLIIENKKLLCRPCSKLGFNRCPLGHFKCMQSLSVNEIVACLNRS